MAGSRFKRDDRNPKKWMIDTTITLPDGSHRHFKKRGYSSKNEASADFSESVNLFIKKSGYKIIGDFEKITDEYIEYKSSKVKISTIFLYKGIISKYLRFDSQSSNTVYSADFLKKFRKKIIDSGLSQSRINKILATFRDVSEFAFNREIIPLNAYRRSRTFLEPISGHHPINRRYKIWTIGQYKEFIATFDDNDKYRVLFKWLFFSGCRIGEALALQWKDFSTEEKTIHIYKTASSRFSTGRSEITSTKTAAGDRFILLNQSMTDDFNELKIAFGQNLDSFLFFGKNKPIGHTTVRRIFTEHTQKANLPRIKIHEIRHSNNTWLLNVDQSREVADIVTRRLGRSSLKVTLDTYYHSDPAVEEELIGKIDI